jgi:5-methylcytosine-specific restriction endonuclease McrA
MKGGEAVTIVLFLDIDWQPLRVAHWTRAMTDVFLGKVEVIEYSRDRTIRCVSREFPMPAVVRVLRRFRRDRLRIRFSRVNIYARDGFTCQYCGQRLVTEELTFDHVVPRSLGGQTTWENIVACCVPCNHHKANRTPAQACMRLRQRPVRPRYLPVLTVQMDRRQVPEEWRPYWNAPLER